MKADI